MSTAYWVARFFNIPKREKIEQMSTNNTNGKNIPGEH
jgi:hypothetical protein